MSARGMTANSFVVTTCSKLKFQFSDNFLATNTFPLGVSLSLCETREQLREVEKKPNKQKTLVASGGTGFGSEELKFQFEVKR